MKQKVIMDVDTGTDDSVAIMVAALSPEIDLVGVSTVVGNCPVHEGTANTLSLFGALGFSIPVYEGMSEPMARPDIFRDGSWPNSPDLPPARTQKQAQHAVDWLIETLMQSGGDITVVPIGPLTNIAVAMKKEPAIRKKIQELIIMGGGNAIGNSTPSAEFNIWMDPEAARVVFQSGCPIRLFPLDVTHKALFVEKDVEDLRKMGRAGQIAAHVIDVRIDMYRRTQPLDRPGAPVHDVMCVCALLEPSLFTARSVHVDVDTNDGLSLGRTIMDLNNRGKGKPNATVAFDVDETRFIQMVKDRLARYH